MKMIYLWNNLGNRENSREDVSDSLGDGDDDIINDLRVVGLNTWSKAQILVIDPENDLIMLL